jgi:hypothetical protein
MKQLVSSLITAMNRSRSGLAETDDQTGAQAQGTPMTELKASELRVVAGGGNDVLGPHGSWGNEPPASP